ncbi:MAG: carbohydrate ABC transporter substrate-binding protein [Desulfobulbaceae bacterium]|mgnify:FL=1|nr:MAG: carbohydrate ABC transporter substrate-binding protein [Desulfobulbaceae bacterium]
MRALVLMVFLQWFVVCQSCFGTDNKTAEVIHWWVSGSENQALQEVAKAFEAEGFKWSETPVKASYQAKSVAITRMLDGVPPTMVQWHAGVALEELYEEGLIRSLAELAQTERWRSVIPAVLWDKLSYDGTLLAVPLTLHGSNWMWGNRQVLDDLDLSFPQTWEALISMAPKIREAGVIPLAVGGQAWQVRLLFNNYLLGVGGPDLYRSVIVEQDPAVIESPAMVSIFNGFRMLKKLIDPYSPDRGWPETTALVIEGKAAFQIMGDWARGEFLQAGKVAGDDFVCGFSPQTQDSYLVVSDVFVAPVVSDGSEEQQIQDRLARVIMNPEVQRKFNIIKGSIPPRTDVSTEGFDLCAKSAIQSLTEGSEVIPGFSMSVKGITANTIMDTIFTFWNNETVSAEQSVRMLADSIRKIRE